MCVLFLTEAHSQANYSEKLDKAKKLYQKDKENYTDGSALYWYKQNSESPSLFITSNVYDNFTPEYIKTEQEWNTKVVPSMISEGWFEYTMGLNAHLLCPVPVHHMCMANKIDTDSKDIKLVWRIEIEDQSFTVSSNEVNATSMTKYKAVKANLVKLKPYPGSTYDRLNKYFKSECITWEPGSEHKMKLVVEVYDYNKKKALLNIASTNYLLKVPDNPTDFRYNIYYSAPRLIRFWEGKVNPRQVGVNKLKELLQDDKWVSNNLPQFKEFIGVSSFNTKTGQSVYAPILGVVYRTNNGGLKYLELFYSLTKACPQYENNSYTRNDLDSYNCYQVELISKDKSWERCFTLYSVRNPEISGLGRIEKQVGEYTLHPKGADNLDK